MYHLNTIMREYISGNRRFIDAHSNFIEVNRTFHNNINNLLRIYDSTYSLNSIPNNNARPRRRSQIPTRRSQDRETRNMRSTLLRPRPPPPIPQDEPDDVLGGSSGGAPAPVAPPQPPPPPDPELNESIDDIAANLTETLSSFLNQRGGVTPLNIIEQECDIIPFSSLENNTQTMCPIDQVPFEPNENVMRIRFCGHIFRESCLRENFRYRSTCPVCRHNIVTTVTHNENFSSPSENNIRWFVRY